MRKLLFVIGLFPGMLFAQKETLDSVVVTGSIHQQKIAASGRNIITIKAESIRDLPVHSIDELLRFVPGLEVQMRGPAGSQSDLLIRGGTFQQVLVLLDGMRLNDPLTGHFNSYIPIAAAEIDRIEILKGASSAVYGSEAVGGVIHIITKTGNVSRVSEGIKAGAQVTLGQFGLRNMDAGLYQQSAKTSWSAGIVSNNADGQLQRGSRGYFHNNTLSASIRTSLNDHWSILFRSAYDHRNFSAQNYYTAFVSDTATEKVSGFWNQMQLQYQKGAHKFSWQSGYKESYDQYVFRKGVTPNQNRSKLIQSQAIYDYSLGNGNNLVSGLQFVEKRIQSNDRGDHVVDQLGAFLLGHFQLKERWHLSPSIRLDYHEQAGWELIPQLNTSYTSGKWVIRASAGKSTRDADFTERYNNTNKPLVTSGNIGNPDLIMEHALSYEVGADYLFHQQFKFSTSLFQKHYSQLIDWTMMPYVFIVHSNNLLPTGSYFVATNISKLKTRGFEADLQWSHSMGNKHQFTGQAGLLWMESDRGASLYISSHARWIFNTAVQYQFGNIKLVATSLYKFRNTQTGNASLASLSKDYFVLNAKLELLLPTQKWSAFVEAQNLLNRSYADRFGVPMPGRWLMAGLRFRY